MNSHEDDMQSLWQQQNDIEKEKTTMWMQLIEEKRTGFDRLVRAANQSEYMGALILSPILAVLAWKAKYPLAQASYGLWSAAWAILAFVTWLAHRERPERSVDGSLREHLQALMKSYDRRIRFLRGAKLGVSIPISAGLGMLCLGIPGVAGNVGVWIFVCLLIGAFLTAQRVSYVRAKWEILEKRHDAERLLRELN